MRKSSVLLLGLALGLAVSSAHAAPWKLDPGTTVTVDVGWNGKIVPVVFPTISGDIDFDEADVGSARASIDLAAADATTGVAVVDALIRGPDYLGTDKFPQITFQLDRLAQVSKTEANISGRVTLRGVTRPMTFRATVFRFGPDKNDDARFEAGFDLTGSIDRTQFGSTGGLPHVSAVLPIRIHLLMTSR